MKNRYYELNNYVENASDLDKKEFHQKLNEVINKRSGFIDMFIVLDDAEFEEISEYVAYKIQQRRKQTIKNIIEEL